LLPSTRTRKGKRAQQAQQDPARVIRDVIIPESITVQELATAWAGAQHRRQSRR